MKITRFIIIFLASAGASFGVGINDIPKVMPCTYTPSVRDPFVDATVSNTLVSAVEARDVRHEAPPIETYTPELLALVQAARKINGIAVSGKSMALVDGKIVRSGQDLIVGLPEGLAAKLMATSRYFGLGLEAEIESKQIQFHVEEISAKGLHLRVRGMRTDIMYEYVKDMSPFSAQKPN